MSNTPATRSESDWPASLALRIEAICQRFEAAWQSGQPPALESFLQQLPQSEWSVGLRELLAVDLEYRRRQGEAPAAHDYQGRFPQHAELIAAVFSPTCTIIAAESPLPWPAPGQELRSFGDYEVLGRIDEGGMGVVYKARQIGLNRLVALKVMRVGAATDSGEARRLRLEAENVARLDHPNIVPIYEVGEHQDQPYFSMKFIEGGNLSRMVSGRAAPTSSKEQRRQAARLVATLARAVQHAHVRGILHRDLKPANILLQPAASADEPPVPLITDFGLAKRLEATPGHTLSQSGAVVGTPEYMSPEQATAQKQLTTATDVYGLGAILYALLAGRPPFRGANLFETLRQVVEQEPAPLRRDNARVEIDLETICLKCLHKKPQQRYSSAQELAEELERFLNNEEIRARPAGRLLKTWRWCQRNRMLATLTGLGAVAMLLALGLLIGFSLYQEQVVHDLSAEQARTKAALDEARLLVANLAFDQGLSLCESGGVDRGILRLAKGLQLTPAGAGDVQEAIRDNLGAWSQQLRPLKAILSHRDALSTAVWSPDGQWIVTGSEDGTAQLWEVATGLPHGAPLVHPSPVTAVAFSPDSRTVLTAAGQGYVRFWTTATGGPVTELLKYPVAPGCLIQFAAFSPDGKTAVTGDNFGHVLRWQVATGQRVGNTLPSPGGARCVAFDTTGRYLVVGNGVSGARVWDAATGALRAEFKGHTGPVRAVAFRKDADQVITGSDDGSVRFWDTHTGKETGVVLRHHGMVYCLCLSPDGKTLLTGCHGRTAHLWEVASGKSLAPPLEHRGEVRAVAFAPDGKTVLTGSRDGTARVWDAVRGVPLSATLSHGGELIAVAFAPQGGDVLTASLDGTARLWGAPPRPANRILPHPQPIWVRAAIFSPNGRYVLTGCEDGYARLWEASTGRLVLGLLFQGNRVRAVAFAPDSKQFLTGGGSRYVQLWRIDRDKATAAFYHGGEVWSLAFRTHDGKILTGGAPNGPAFWDPRRPQQPLWRAEHKDLAMYAALSPDGRTILTGSMDRTAQLWDAETGKPCTPPLQHAGQVTAVAFGPDGRLAATGAMATGVGVWDVRTGRRLGEFLPHQGWINNLVFSPDGKILASAGMDRTARLWDVAAGQLLGPPLAHQERVYDVNFHPDGKHVITGSGDATARLWHIRTRRPVGPPILHQNPVSCAVFSPDGKTILTTSVDKTARLTPMPTSWEGSVEETIRWVQVATGLELDSSGAIRVLSRQTWEELREDRDKLNRAPPALH
jgi:WD40 repeat protein